MPTPVKTPREGPNPLCTTLRDKFLALQPEVYRDIRFRVRTHPNRNADADDILQRAALKALRRIETFHGTEDDLERWFYRVGRNSVIDEHRRGRPERRVGWMDSSVIEEVICHNGPSPEEMLIMKDLKEKKRKAFLALVRNLPPQMGVMIKLRYAGYSDEEIAGRTGVAEVTVRTNIFRAIKKARKLIDNSRAA